MGGYQSEPITEKETKSGSNNGIEFAMSCMQGWREGMKDAYICESEFDKDLQLYAIFDSHCNYVAEYISNNFGKELKKRQAYKKKDFETALKQTFLKIDILLKTGREEISQINYKNWLKDDWPRVQLMMNVDQENYKKLYLRQLKTELTYTACSANVTLIYKNQVYVANIGDSRCVLSCDGDPVSFNKDHKPDHPIKSVSIVTDINGTTYKGYTENYEQSRPLEDLSFQVNDISKTDDYQTNALPDIFHYQFSEKDEFLLIGSNGICKLKTDQELISICRKNISENVPMTKIVENLLDQIIAEDTEEERRSCYSMRMILVKIKPNIVINNHNEYEKNDKNNSEGYKDCQMINKDDKNIENNLNFKL